MSQAVSARQGWMPSVSGRNRLTEDLVAQRAQLILSLRQIALAQRDAHASKAEGAAIQEALRQVILLLSSWHAAASFVKAFPELFQVLGIGRRARL